MGSATRSSAYNEAGLRVFSMIASLVIGALLIVTGLALLAKPRVWDWARDQVGLRASEVLPAGADHDRIVRAYLKILRVIRVFFGPWLLLLGLAALLVMDAQIAALAGGVALLVAASFVQIFWRFVPTVAYAAASAVFFGGIGLALGIGVTGSLWLPLGAGLTLAAVATASRVVALRLNHAAAMRTRRVDRPRLIAAFALGVLSLALGLGPVAVLLALLGVPWVLVGGWLAVCAVSVLIGLWFRFRTGTSR